MAAEGCSACYQLVAAEAAPASAAVSADSSADPEAQWVAGVEESHLVVLPAGIQGLQDLEDRTPLDYSPEVAQAGSPCSPARRQAVLGSHEDRLGLGSEAEAEIDSEAVPDIRIDLGAAGMEVEGHGTDSAAEEVDFVVEVGKVGLTVEHSSVKAQLIATGVKQAKQRRNDQKEGNWRYPHGFCAIGRKLF